MRRPPKWRAPVPVICIGNFTAGGTGKTPLALRVAEMLTTAGEQPAFLTRGYGGRIRGPHIVAPSLDTARDVGDEALMLAARAPTCVSADRVSGARLLVAQAEPPSVIVMDDGLQNPSLAKDITIVVVDGARGIGNGLVLPAGPLRAPLVAQMAGVSAIVVNGRGQEGEGGGAIGDRLRARFPGPVLSVVAEPCAPLDWLRAGSWIAFAGIGNPERFFAMLRREGCDVVHTQAFADHHPYSERDAAELLDTARSVQAGLVTTEKDHVRLIGSAGRCGELADTARTVPIRLSLAAADVRRLEGLLMGALATRRQTADSSRNS
ncbi:MAG: tetraacyldisaccharide 4'-kinase [Hyphomicrobiaceae bacterium]